MTGLPAPFSAGRMTCGSGHTVKQSMQSLQRLRPAALTRGMAATFSRL